MLRTHKDFFFFSEPEHLRSNLQLHANKPTSVNGLARIPERKGYIRHKYARQARRYIHIAVAAYHLASTLYIGNLAGSRRIAAVAQATNLVVDERFTQGKALNGLMAALNVLVVAYQMLQQVAGILSLIDSWTAPEE